MADASAQIADKAERQRDKKCYLAKMAAAAASELVLPAVHVAVTRAGCAEALPLLHLVASGAVFGDHPVSLRAHDKPQRHALVRARLMELKASGFGALREAVVTRSLRVALTDADAVFLLPRTRRFADAAEEAEVRRQNYLLFKFYGLALRDHGSPKARVVCTGPHACLLGAICALLAMPAVPERHVTCVSRVEEARARALVSQRLKEQAKRTVPAGDVRGARVWGHPPAHCVGDLRAARAPPAAAAAGQLYDLVGDVRWIREVMSQPVASELDGRPLRLEGAWALAAARHMADWWQGTPPGCAVPMCVPSDGAYDVPEHMFFSFPVTVTPDDREWHIVKDVALDTFTESLMRDAVEAQTRQLRHALVTLMRARLAPAPPSTLPSEASSPASSAPSFLRAELDAIAGVPDWFAAGDVCSETRFRAHDSAYSFFDHSYRSFGAEEGDEAGAPPPYYYPDQEQYAQMPYGEQYAQGDQAAYGQAPYGPEQYPGQAPYGEEYPGQYGPEQYPPQAPYGPEQYGEQYPAQAPYGPEQYGEQYAGQAPYEEQYAGQAPYEEQYAGQAPYGQEQYAGQAPYGPEQYPGQDPYQQYGDPYAGQAAYAEDPYAGQAPPPPPAGDPQYGAQPPYAGEEQYADQVQPPDAYAAQAPQA